MYFQQWIYPKKKKPEFSPKGVWIPGEVAFNEDLSFTERFVFWIVEGLDNEETHCFASNEYIAGIMGVKESTIRNSISKLVKKGYLRRVSFDGRTRVIAVDKSYKKKYEHLVEKFRRGLKKPYGTSKKQRKLSIV